jgi:hypothetical protein
VEAPGAGGRRVGAAPPLAEGGQRKVGTMRLHTQFVGRPGTVSGTGWGATAAQNTHTRAPDEPTDNNTTLTGFSDTNDTQHDTRHDTRTT